MAIDLSGLTVPELEQLVKDAGVRIAAIKVSRMKEVRRQVEDLARQQGFSIGELFSKSSDKAPDGKKYANPDNPMQFWSGRGKRPRWLSDAMAGGAALESFLTR